jgi:hypothetical protein
MVKCYIVEDAWPSRLGYAMVHVIMTTVYAVYVDYMHNDVVGVWLLTTIRSKIGIAASASGAKRDHPCRSTWYRR